MIRTLIVLAVVAFLVALYFYPLSTIKATVSDEAVAVGKHLMEQAKK